MTDVRRDWLFPSCEVYGHDWKSLGGCNAGCDELCACSVPVHECTRCKDCDYGENDEAIATRERCTYAVDRAALRALGQDGGGR